MSHTGGNQEFELNLAPIIDSFTVLIAFMLVSASFLSIGIMDAGVAAAGAQAQSATPPSINVTIELARDQRLQIKVAGKSEEKIQIAAKDGTYDFGVLEQRLGALRSRWSDLNAVTLISEDSIQYKDVVQVMEKVRKTVPVVLLGGF